MRRSIARVAVILAGAVALVGPARAEWSALQRIRRGVSRCDDPSVGNRCGGLARADVDLEGLRLWRPWHERAGLHAEAEQVAIGFGLDGVTVDAHGLSIARAVVEAPAPAAPADDHATAEPAGAEPTPSPSPFRTHGIPVHLRAHGLTTWTHAGVELTLDSPELHLDGQGGATASFGLRAEGSGLHVEGQRRFQAEAIDGDPRRWHAEGPLVLAGGPPMLIAMDLDSEGLDARLHDDGGGHLRLRAPLPAPGQRRPAWLSLQAERFALAALGRTGARTLDRFGLRAAQATLDADLHLEAAPGSTVGSLEVQQLHLRGLIVDQPKLARDPVAIDGLRARGDLQWSSEGFEGALVVQHREAEVSLSAVDDAEHLRVRVDLAPLPCQQLIASMPDAMTDMSSGTELHGELSAHAELELDKLELALARAQAQRPHDAPPPGRFEIDFPFLERCTIVADDPRLDLSALSGAYRHRFVDDQGSHQVRLMARGGPSYASLAEVPLLAQAFVTLEDRRFWDHDGFDREQMVNALWFNLVQGRVRRGASTISQQAARNLWLGVDRSWGRKLQEALLTVRLESSTSKARIMELYLNVIELGPGIHGVEDAARFYFGKPASELSVLQAVHIAMLAPAPNRFAREMQDGQVSAQWREQLDDHLRRMYRAGYIDRVQMIGALRDDLELLDRR